MNPCEHAGETLPGIFQWSAYSPEHRIGLTSTAVLTGNSWWIFDPIPLVPKGREFLGKNPVAAIVLTNENHERDADRWSTEFDSEIWAAPEAELEEVRARRWVLEPSEFPQWTLYPLPGGAGGETGWFLEARSLMVFGDAVVNLADRNLELLPDKYCLDPKRLRDSLRRLPTFAHAVFAHGEPLLEHASQRIAALL